MDAVVPPAGKSSHNLFEVYLRLRPSPATGQDRILSVEEGDDGGPPSHITLNPPTDRRRAIEKFAFTRVFDEAASQLDVFRSADIASLAEGVLAPGGGEGTDAVIATLGVTGSGKTHTILGSRTQRGLTQLVLDVLFRAIGPNMLDQSSLPHAIESLQAADPSEAVLCMAPHFLDATYADPACSSRATSRATTPMTVMPPHPRHTISLYPKRMQVTSEHGVTSPPPRRNLARPSAPPQSPDVSGERIASDETASYAIVVSMYEVHNDRIYDLLTPPARSAVTKDFRRRALLFKSTEMSPDRKVVAGLRKVACTSLEDAIMVLEAGLVERRVAGTGSNSVSSRSHGFFCFEVKKRSSRTGPWRGSRLTIVDMAGSERARDAKTQGATLVEAGKINESLMYLGQCLQTQSEAGTSTKPNVVPYRQCKLTELLFSNSFPSTSAAAHPQAPRRNAQKGVMIVTADPRGDFNATSQILRYSALAREVTVPRIPSIAATILANPPATTATHRSMMLPHRGHSPVTTGAEDRATMELAALEIARMSEEMDQLRLQLEAQAEAREAAEAHLLSAEERLMEMETAVRDECATEFEQRLSLELARFKASLAQEQERNDEHWDRKVDVLERGLNRGDEEDDKENVLVEDLSQEVARLRRDNSVLRRELATRSPSKRAPLAERDDFIDPTVGVSRQLERLRVSSAGSPAKRVRKMGARRWEEPPEDSPPRLVG
ncbi:hypothetical protein L249_8731 [Ophiocordyceps polyrhachis-furcata BCC 54312]|uniref:Kinesin motor domain-containing protein n=1 Tax=Ophiocordyceps polyrhachis-furcata BCC 54312 TaxID=1330021 RepID=A0A367L6G7_9HYPO|nr:hypothetical protein L249_8731 [Ophiocordyceps polyrhachis-furcata BCC 54312]